MRLQEAIKHAKDQAKKLGDCKCGKEHAQLAKWLEDLQFRRKMYKAGARWAGRRSPIFQAQVKLNRSRA